MRIADLLLQDLDLEIANTRRTLERVPENNPDFKCHERSTPLGKLAMHCAVLPLMGHYILEDDGMDKLTTTRPRIPLIFTSREACLRLFDDAAASCRASLAAATDEHLGQIWRYTAGEHLISSATRSQSLLTICLNHLIHHTAQLGVYLRLNEIPVPALYGPSADEQPAPAR